MPDKKQESKQPFVAEEDRPPIKLDPDQPIAELRVRDLHAILGTAFTKPVLADKPDKEPLKETKEKEILAEKPDKEPLKETKEKEPLLEKPDKEPLKEHKHEKFEVKDLKHEKSELDPVKRFAEHFDPGPERFSGIKGVIERLAHEAGGLSARIDELANQVDELKKLAGQKN